MSWEVTGKVVMPREAGDLCFGITLNDMSGIFYPLESEDLLRRPTLRSSVTLALGKWYD